MLRVEGGNSSSSGVARDSAGRPLDMSRANPRPCAAPTPNIAVSDSDLRVPPNVTARVFSEPRRSHLHDSSHSLDADLSAAVNAEADTSDTLSGPHTALEDAPGRRIRYRGKQKEIIDHASVLGPEPLLPDDTAEPDEGEVPG